MDSEKTLILFDTNKIRNVLKGSPRYDSFEFGREFNELKTFLEKNKITDCVTLVITEMTLSELLNQKKKSYEQDISDLNSIVLRLRNLDNVSIPELALPEENFDCITYLKPKVITFLEESNVQIIKIENEKKALVFDVLVQKVIDIIPPFKAGQRDSCNGQGFKDAVIWETFKQSDIAKDYSTIILFTGDSDFAGCEQEVEEINFKTIKSTEFLIQELRSIYHRELLKEKYKKVIRNQYLVDNLKQLIASEIDSNPKDIDIVNLTEKIIDNPIDLKNQFTSIEDEEYFENMVGFISKIKVNDSEYSVASLFDLGSNEIDTIQIEEVQ
ncbi:MAG: hypothetical protein SYNGOMJ08_00653 [Candidatus Syntrophoarchaeum sp. GoM_oil]|nr:MAG: hypothetical protein SYNGOMJ08_00653 [Candidatus Syntrophoarchaeum sp. GoM_oil]